MPKPAFFAQSLEDDYCRAARSMTKQIANGEENPILFIRRDHCQTTDDVSSYFNVEKAYVELEKGNAEDPYVKFIIHFSLMDTNSKNTFINELDVINRLFTCISALFPESSRSMPPRSSCPSISMEQQEEECIEIGNFSRG